MKFNRKIQQKIVSASGAITRLLAGWLKVSRTLWSTKPTTISTKVWSLPGTPVVAFFATRLNRNDEHEAEQDGERHRVDVDREEIAVAFVPDPGAVLLADGQVLEMVGDVLAG